MIEVKNLTKVFQGNVKAVNSVSFKLDKGEIGCIIGTSGCGKTTTLKMINRLIEPSEGDVWVGNEECHDTDPVNWRRKIGYVIQKAGLLPHLTVEQNISLLSNILKKDKQYMVDRVTELLETINMPYEKFAKRYPIELSGGQQQRVGIARALMEDPPVMLMDEPFGALDPITRESLHEEFIGLNKRLKKTILMVTHDMDEAFKLGDKVILMNKGEIVQMGTREDLTQNPKNEFVESFVKGHANA
ncbi:MAG: ATP-binding cassette domain-containing protein [Bacteriovoracaceae bacterium]|nr:ATP-binding cassette domain-containing protein [Bacteriovoracaceae bacterium]